MKAGQKVTPTGVLLAPAGLPEGEWLALRRTGIGGSDVGALLGMSKYTSAYELYLDKRGELPVIPRPEALDRAARWGHLHEPLLAQEFSRRHGVKTRRIGLIRHVTEPWMLANLDRQVHGCPDGPCLLEIKNRSAWKEKEWGESGAPDGVPDTEALQTLWYIAVTGYGHAHVAVLINGNDDRYYRVDRDDDLIGDVLSIADGFWRQVQDGVPPAPDAEESTAQMLAQVWRPDSDAVRVLAPGEVEDLLAARERGQAMELEGKTIAVAASNQLRVILGDREVAIVDGQPAFTWKQNGQFSAKRFTQAHPDLARQYMTLVPQVDVEAIKADRPDIYREFRARVLRVPSGGAAA